MRLRFGQIQARYRKLQREIHPPTPCSEATVCVVTTCDITELTATAVVALYELLCCRFERLDTVEKQCGGECQSIPVERKSISTFPHQDKPFELPSEMGFRFQKPVTPNGPSWTNTAIKRLAKANCRRSAQPAGRPV